MMVEEDSHIQDELDVLEEDSYVAGRECFNSKELERASFILRDCKSPKGRFLCVYSRFLVSPYLYEFKVDE